MSGVHREAIQKQIHQDWANREYIEVITASIKRITDFLNSFGKLILSGSHNPEIAYNYLYNLRITRHVLSFSPGRVERKTDHVGATNRLLGSVCNERRNAHIKWI